MYFQFDDYTKISLFPATMNFMDLANLLDSDGNMQNEMMVMAFAATMLATIPGNKNPSFS